MSRVRAEREHKVELSGVSLLLSRGTNMSDLAFSRELSSGEVVGVVPLDEERYAVFFGEYQSEYVYSGGKVSSFKSGRNAVLAVSSFSGGSRVLEGLGRPDEEWLSVDSSGAVSYLLLKRGGETYVRSFKADSDRVVELGEEFVPEGESKTGVVTFDKGLTCDNSNIYVYGSDSEGSVFVSRKSRVDFGGGGGWSYLDGRSFSDSLLDLQPLPSPSGPLTSGESVQGLLFRNSLYLVTLSGGVLGVYKENRNGVWESTNKLTLGEGVESFSLEPGLPSDNSTGRTPTLPVVYNRKSSDGTIENVWVKLTL